MALANPLGLQAIQGRHLPVEPSKMKVGEMDFTRETKGQGESYSLSKLISAASSFGCWPTSNFSMTAAHEWERVSPAFNRPGAASVATNTGFPDCPKTIDPPVSP